MEATPQTIAPPAPGVVVTEQPPPMMLLNQQQAHTATGGHGSVGAVIGVVAAIALLGIIAGMIGRLCSGRAVMGYGGHFDVESWVETKCSSCVDGHVGPPPRHHPPVMVAPPALDTGGDGSGARNGTSAAQFPVAGVPMTTSTGEVKTEVTGAEREEQEERETSDEEQLHHRHSHHGEEEGDEHEHPVIFEELTCNVTPWLWLQTHNTDSATNTVLVHPLPCITKYVQIGSQLGADDATISLYQNRRKRNLYKILGANTVQIDYKL